MRAFLEGLRNRIFPLGIPLSWLQLIGERKRFFAAIAGVTFAVTLMMYQMGIYVAIFEKVVYKSSKRSYFGTLREKFDFSA